MKMKKVCIIGHLGEGQNLLNGQTVKTKIVISEIIENFGDEQLETIDTHGGLSSFVRKMGCYFKAFKTCKNIIIMPAENGLRVLTPMLTVVNTLYRRKIHYVVIGGWLPRFISNKPILRKMLKSFKSIYVETNAMKSGLERMGFSNVIVMPNCKNIEINKNISCHENSFPLRLCTFSRVMKEKGIEEAVNAVIMVNEKEKKIIYTLDIYGQIEKSQEEWFADLSNKFPKYIKYCGIVDYDKSAEVLKNYFALLFPTYYDGEGFAGTLIDAFAAGLPVIASDWKYNSEIIDNKTGMLCKPKDTVALRNALIQIKEDTDTWTSMKYYCVERAKMYLPQNALKVLINEVK
ncbi:glycosyltransferase family 4 protein [Clostridium perfringens]|uniref:glycosyltransferase family 4 protein n=2 Tax=Clostridium perfringens TaxID=1502 RepID=UPI001FA84EAF|nr:glycosyltransferase [Clostridium perfringens]